jgi:hypothetical protein
MKNLFKALSDFQQEVPVIHQDTKGYNYTYASLGTILEVINPLLKKYGLGYTQLLKDKGLTTIIFHIESGEQIESTVELPIDSLKGMNAYQSAGSAITYFRRYSLSSALSLITDKDIDASGDRKEVKKEDNRKWLVPNTVDWDNAISKGKALNEVEKYYKLRPEVKEEYLEALMKPLTE